MAPRCPVSTTDHWHVEDGEVGWYVIGGRPARDGEPRFGAGPFLSEAQAERFLAQLEAAFPPPPGCTCRA